MSRIRILNLPKVVDENQLRDHLSPHLLHGVRDITDINIIRNSSGAVRMAFVGFQSATMGTKMIKELDGTYFGTMAMKVGAALGLKESRELKEKEEEARREQIQNRKLDKKKAIIIAGGDSAEQKGEGEDGENKQKQKGEEEEEGEDNDDETFPKRRDRGDNNNKKKDEINERLLLQQQSSNQPSWGGELLVPPPNSAAAAASSSSALEQNQKRQNQKKKFSDDDEDEDDDENEQQAKKEKGPDISSDDAFLRSITSATTTNQNKNKTNEEKSKEQKELEEQERELETTTRVRITNLPYVATSKDLKNFFSSKVGEVVESHIPLTKDTKQSKGAGYIRFASHESAKSAVENCDGAVFMGRVVRVNLSPEDPYSKLKQQREAAELEAGEDSSSSSSSFKQMKDAKRKKADDLGLSWNSTYVGSSTAVSLAAKQLGVESSDILNSSRQGAAVRAAVAEAHITTDARKTLGAEGINYDLLSSGKSSSLLSGRSDTTILVKHIAEGTSLKELSGLFARCGPLDTIAAPPDVSIALIRFVNSENAQTAFQRLAYKKVKGTPLFLEWAPIGSISDESGRLEEENQISDVDNKFKKKTTGATDENADEQQQQQEQEDNVESKTIVHTVYVTNLPFGVSESSLRDFLADSISKIASKPELILKISLQAEKGRVYITVADGTTEALLISKLDGKSFQGRTLSAQISRSSTATAAAASAAQKVKHQKQDEEMLQAQVSSNTSSCPPGRDPLKLIVKNLPFEATEADLRQLFSSFSEIKSVRVPRRVQKFNAHHTNNHRGFGFVEFLTEDEAAKAKVSLGSTHLYGRHLVLDFAEKSVSVDF